MSAIGDYITHNVDGDSTSEAVDQAVWCDVDVTLGDGTVMSDFNALIFQTHSGETFMTEFFGGEQLDGLEIQSISPVAVNNNLFGRMAHDQSIDGSVIVCFAPETQIQTPSGQRRADCLNPKDLVMTLDNGPLAVQAIVQEKGYAHYPNQASVVFDIGRLGTGFLIGLCASRHSTGFSAAPGRLEMG